MTLSLRLKAHSVVAYLIVISGSNLDAEIFRFINPLLSVSARAALRSPKTNVVCKSRYFCAALKTEPNGMLRRENFDSKRVFPIAQDMTMSELRDIIPDSRAKQL